MRRRDFVTLLGSLSLGPSLLATPVGAQQSKKRPTIGILGAQTEATQGKLWAGFVERLHTLGWSEGRNIAIEYRWAEARNDRFEQIAAEFVKLDVDLIATSSTPTVIAAKRATSSIPIVFTNASDPVANGLVTSLNRPGGNVTGLSTQLADTTGKRLGLLREVVPQIHRLAVLTSADDPAALHEAREVEAVARSLGMDVTVTKVGNADDDLGPSFGRMKGTVDGLYVCNSNVFNKVRRRIVALVLDARLPAIYDSAGFVELGGLISYGPNGPALFRRAAELADKILRGTKPSDIPIEQPTEFFMAINLAAAKSIQVSIPDALIHLSDRIVDDE